MTSRGISLLFGLNLVVTLAACSNLAPDFDQLYRVLPDQEDQAAIPPPVIVIPGLLGTRLKDPETGREVWPGQITNVALSRFRNIVLPLPDYAGSNDPGDEHRLEPNRVTETVLRRDFYGELVRILVRYGGYQRADPGEPITDKRRRRVYVFDYDWRQDNVATAQELDTFLNRIAEDYGERDLKFDIIAHSMGGLVARYFLRFGTEDVLNNNRLKVTWAGAPRVNKMILLGVPNLGSVSSIEGFIRGYTLGLRRVPQEVVATLPSTYQLFPHRIVNWLYDTQGRVIDQDQFSRATWAEFQWNIFDPEVKARVLRKHGAEYYAALERTFTTYSERARRFSWSLTVCPNYEESVGGCPEFSEPPVRLVVFGGNCNLTPSAWVLEQSEGESQVRFSPEAITAPVPGIDYTTLMYDPGDGTVTKPSLLARDVLSPNTPRHEFSYFPLAYSFLLCEHHATLSSNTHFQDNLLDVLLTNALPWELHKDAK